MKVLVVDDSAVQRRKIASFLEKRGVEVEQASDGAQALQKLNGDTAYSVLLTDWNMPNMDGLTLVKAVRAQPELGQLYILMVTTENDPWAVTRAIRAGANEYLMKPFDDQALWEKLLTMLGPDHELFRQTLA